MLYRAVLPGPYTIESLLNFPETVSDKAAKFSGFSASGASFQKAHIQPDRFRWWCTLLCRTELPARANCTPRTLYRLEITATVSLALQRLSSYSQSVILKREWRVLHSHQIFGLRKPIVRPEHTIFPFRLSRIRLGVALGCRMLGFFINDLALPQSTASIGPCSPGRVETTILQATTTPGAVFALKKQQIFDAVWREIHDVRAQGLLQAKPENTSNTTLRLSAIAFTKTMAAIPTSPHPTIVHCLYSPGIESIPVTDRWDAWEQAL